MRGRFAAASEVQRDKFDWGEIGWLSRPATTNANAATVAEVILHPGEGHDFHKHPNQEETIYVLAGAIEQWIETDSRSLGPGDSAFVEPDTVHASFNASDKPAKLVVVLGPCVGDEGYELVDVSEELPWKTLR